jgi:hypothetical protein
MCTGSENGPPRMQEVPQTGRRAIDNLRHAAACRNVATLSDDATTMRDHLASRSLSATVPDSPFPCVCRVPLTLASTQDMVTAADFQTLMAAHLELCHCLKQAG